MEQGMRTGDHFMRPQTQHQGRRPDNQTAAQHHHHHQPPPPQKCPRCDSSNTKFCYYNNYSLSQPRYFCKACRRYWTHGGTLRNVPVGGGCRKSKRPKPSTPSSSTAGQVSRNQSFSAPQNLTGTNPGQPLIRAPIMPSMGNNNSFYTGPGVFLSSLAAMQSLPAGAATANYGGGNGQYDANMTILQNLQSLRPHHHHQAQNDHQIFPSQQSLNVNPARPLGSWTQSFVRGPAASSSASAGPSSGFWSRAAANGENQANSSSFNPNDWPDNSNNNNPAGFDPSG